MHSINFLFPVNASAEKVFGAISTPSRLNNWWTASCEAEQKLGGIYDLYFEPDYYWKAEVTKWIDNREFELRMIKSDQDWNGTQVGFRLKEKNKSVELEFYHKNWNLENDHFKTTAFCWAMYLRILKRYLEFGEVVPYRLRLDV
ncbi:MAG: SRPBCC domain-containing protein [Bacteroidetes bacterium]|nr:SRPBCC domain-containing protein [Bacteroidota bacterium]